MDTQSSYDFSEYVVGGHYDPSNPYNQVVGQGCTVFKAFACAAAVAACAVSCAAGPAACAACFAGVAPGCLECVS